MEQLEQWVLPGLAVVTGFVIILFILVIVLAVKLRTMRKKYRSLMNGSKGTDLEEVIIEIQSRLNQQVNHSEQVTAEIRQIQEAMKAMKSRVGIHRYSAFGDMGNSDLSFTIAILDDLADGVVITSIYGRDQTYIYAKPIQKGVSTYTLSPEEKEAILRTMQQVKA